MSITTPFDKETSLTIWTIGLGTFLRKSAADFAAVSGPTPQTALFRSFGVGLMGFGICHILTREYYVGPVEEAGNWKLNFTSSSEKKKS